MEIVPRICVKTDKCKWRSKWLYLVDTKCPQGF